MPRLTKIYTRLGDEGETMLGAHKVSKDNLLVEAVGSIDELNSFIGFALSFCSEDVEINKVLTSIQNELFDLGGELHLPTHPAITEEKVTALENHLDRWNDVLPPLEEFILPRGDHATTAMHVARTVCRRAERAIVRLHRQTPLQNPQIIRYLNRLSDLLFVIARTLQQKTHQQEMMWDHNKNK